MSYVTPFALQMHVSLEALMPAEYVIQEMVRRCTRYAHEHGFPFFDDRALAITDTVDHFTNHTTYTAKWCPPSHWPCEFEGGSAHGELRVLPKNMATVNVIVAVKSRYDWDGRRDDTLPVTTEVFSYTIAGINPVSNRWVYTFE